MRDRTHRETSEKRGRFSGSRRFSGPGRLAALGRLGLALALGLPAAACGAPSRVPLSARQAGTTTILVTNHLDAADAIEHLRVSVDETLLPLATVPPRQEDAAALGTLRLGPGPHAISVRVTTRAPDGSVGVVEARQIFHVQGTANEIDIVLRSRPDAGGIDARVAVDLTMAGGKMGPELGEAPPADKDARCAPLQPIPRAICRAAADLDEASRRNDLVGVLCIRDKLGEMRKLSLIGETGGQNVAGMAQKRVEDLGREIDRCAGDVTIGADGLTVIKPGASAPPLPPPPRLPASQFPAYRSVARY
ncbi:MAG: hypothetical protein U0359_23755 [Byssovorax sp.]